MGTLFSISSVFMLILKFDAKLCSLFYANYIAFNMFLS